MAGRRPAADDGHTPNDLHLKPPMQPHPTTPTARPEMPALTLAPAAPPAAARPGPEDAPPRGCGWFDSSHELRRGLLVLEHGDAAAARLLPLDAWLDWHGRPPRR